MVFQEQSLLPNMQVAENILLGHEGKAVRLGIYNWRKLSALAERQLSKIGASISPEALTETLSFAERQLVEFAKVLSLEERTRHEPIILLDEPTSALDASEIEVVLGEIERLRERASVVFVSHRLDEVLRVSDRVYVMTNGRCVAERQPEKCDAAELQRLMLGRDLACSMSSAERRSRRRPGLPASTCEGSSSRSWPTYVRAPRRRRAWRSRRRGLRPRDAVSHTVRRGTAPGGGPVGRARRVRQPRRCGWAGVGYVPAERRTEGIIGGLSVKKI